MNVGIDTTPMRRRVEPLVFYVDGRSTLSPPRRGKSRSCPKNLRHTKSTPDMRVTGASFEGSTGMNASFDSSDDELSIYTNGYKPKHSVNTWNVPKQISPTTVKYTGRNFGRVSNSPLKVNCKKNIREM